MCKHKFIDNGILYWKSRFDRWNMFIRDDCKICENCGSEKIISRYYFGSIIPSWFEKTEKVIEDYGNFDNRELFNIRHCSYPDYPELYNENDSNENYHYNEPTQIKSIIIER